MLSRHLCSNRKTLISTASTMKVPAPIKENVVDSAKGISAYTNPSLPLVKQCLLRRTDLKATTQRNTSRASYPLSELFSPGTKTLRSGTLSSAPQLVHIFAEGLLSVPHSLHNPRGWVTSLEPFPPSRFLFSPLHFPQSSQANPQAIFDSSLRCGRSASVAPNPKLDETFPRQASDCSPYNAVTTLLTRSLWHPRRSRRLRSPWNARRCRLGWASSCAAARTSIGSRRNQGAAFRTFNWTTGSGSRRSKTHVHTPFARCLNGDRSTGQLEVNLITRG